LQHPITLRLIAAPFSFSPKFLENEFRYILQPFTITTTIRKLLDHSNQVNFSKIGLLDEKLTVKPRLLPNVQSGVTTGVGTLLLLEVVPKGNLRKGILSRTVICELTIFVKVKESGSNIMLDDFNAFTFALTRGGVVNCVGKIISNNELERSGSSAVDIWIQPIISVRQWDRFKMKDIGNGFVDIVPLADDDEFEDNDKLADDDELVSY